MEQTQTTTGGSIPPPTGELVRPLEGRMVAGVALALARRLELPEWVVRVGFIVTAFLGGLGVILYIAGWALIRSETERESAAERFFGRAGTVRSWIGIGLIALAAMIVFGQFSIFNDGFTWAAALLVVGLLLYSGVVPTPGRPASEDHRSPDPGGGPDTASAPAAALAVATAPQPPRTVLPPTPPPPPPSPAPLPPRERSYLGRLALGVAMLALGVLAILDLAPIAIDPGPRHYLALLVVVLGAALVVGAFRGRARFLILVGLMLIPALFAAPLLERNFAGNWARSYYPTSFADLQSSYAVEVGRLDLDLTGLPWDGEIIDLRVDGDAAAINVWVPHRLSVEGRLDADVGRLSSSSGGTGGFNPPALFLDEPGETPVLGSVRLNGRVDIGSIEIHRVYMEEMENQP